MTSFVKRPPELHFIPTSQRGTSDVTMWRLVARRSLHVLTQQQWRRMVTIQTQGTSPRGLMSAVVGGTAGILIGGFIWEK